MNLAYKPNEPVKKVIRYSLLEWINAPLYSACLYDAMPYCDYAMKLRSYAWENMEAKHFRLENNLFGVPIGEVFSSTDLHHVRMMFFKISNKDEMDLLERDFMEIFKYCHERRISMSHLTILVKLKGGIYEMKNPYDHTCITL